MGDGDRITDYGFTFGPTEVTRICTFVVGEKVRSRILGIKTPFREIEVYISPTGRSVRVFDAKTHEELTR